MIIQSAPPKIVTQEYLKELEQEMMAAAEEMEFERAAAIRDKIQRNKNRIGQPVESLEGQQPQGDRSKPSGGFKNRRQRGPGRGSRNFRKDRDGEKDGE
jgi:excinuclease ABC subunit B